MPESGHIPVLMEPVLRLLDPQPGELVLDCTLGRGGHSAAFAEAVASGGASGGGGGGSVIGFDLDAANIDFTERRIRARVPDFTGFQGFHESFVRAPARLGKLGRRADVVFADLGFCSSQMDDPSRGFSFRVEGPLDMRLDPTAPITAADLVATLDEPELARIIYEYGEDPLARKIARKLAQNRTLEPIQTTTRLAKLVEEAYGVRARSSRLHPATRTFRALRIAVNDELGALRSLLDAITRQAQRDDDSGWMNAAARVGIISFHSLEDRLVKRAFVDLEKRGMLTRLNKRPLTADEQEIRLNPRARSAKLRVARMATPDEM